MRNCIPKGWAGMLAGGLLIGLFGGAGPALAGGALVGVSSGATMYGLRPDPMQRLHWSTLAATSRTAPGWEKAAW